MNIVLSIINLFLSFLEFMVLIEVVCSWIPPLQNTTFAYYINKFNYPFLNPIRKLLFKSSYGMMVDLSPIILFLVIRLVRQIIWNF